MNESILKPISQIPIGAAYDQYTTIEACKQYASHAITMQYVFGAMALIAIGLTFYILNKKGNLKPTKEEIQKIKSYVKDDESEK